MALLLRDAASSSNHNEKEWCTLGSIKIKNSARDGPEGQSKKADSAMCNAGLPHYSGAFLSAPKSDKVSMKKRKRRKGTKRTGAGADFILSLASKSLRQPGPTFRFTKYSVQKYRATPHARQEVVEHVTDISFVRLGTYLFKSGLASSSGFGPWVELSSSSTTFVHSANFYA